MMNVFPDVSDSYDNQYLVSMFIRLRNFMIYLFEDSLLFISIIIIFKPYIKLLDKLGQKMMMFIKTNFQTHQCYCIYLQYKQKSFPVLQRFMNIKNMKQSFLIDEDELIGEGAFSKVYRSGTTESTAIKVYEKSRESAELVEHAKRQHNILQNIQSPYICSLRKSFETNRKFYMVQKFQQGQSLDVQLKKRKRFSCKDALIVFKQLLNAMEYLINKKIMHRDLKPQNIIYRNGKIVLIDFGFACYFHKNDQKILTSVVGTPNYMSPQLLSCKKYNSKSDIWSLGVILYELISGQLPFEGKDTRQLLKEIESKTISFKNNLFSPTAQFLINRCLRISVSERIDWKQLFEWKNTGKLPQSKYNGSSEKKFKYQLTSMQKQKQEVNCSCNIFKMFQ